MTDIFVRLSNPFPPAKISWRVGQITKANKNKASALCYVDARDVMNRLDEVCGPAGWEDSYCETAKGRLLCTIRIRVGDEWISKSDGAGDTAVEGEKGAISDAFKRCAVKWGIGRYLYDIPIQWVEINDFKQIVRSEAKRLQEVLPGSIIFSDGAPEYIEEKKPVVPTETTLREWASTVGVAIKGAKTQTDVDKALANPLVKQIHDANINTYNWVVEQARQKHEALQLIPTGV